MSPGTARPTSLSASLAPRAIWSFAAKMAWNGCPPLNQGFHRICAAVIGIVTLQFEGRVGRYGRGHQGVPVTGEFVLCRLVPERAGYVHDPTYSVHSSR